MISKHKCIQLPVEVHLLYESALFVHRKEETAVAEIDR